MNIFEGKLTRATMDSVVVHESSRGFSDQVRRAPPCVVPWPSARIIPFPKPPRSIPSQPQGPTPRRPGGKAHHPRPRAFERRLPTRPDSRSRCWAPTPELSRALAVGPGHQSWSLDWDFDGFWRTFLFFVCGSVVLYAGISKLYQFLCEYIIMCIINIDQYSVSCSCSYYVLLSFYMLFKQPDPTAVAD